MEITSRGLAAWSALLDLKGGGQDEVHSLERGFLIRRGEWQRRPRGMPWARLKPVYFIIGGRAARRPLQFFQNHVVKARERLDQMVR